MGIDAYAAVNACFLRHAESAARRYDLDPREVMLEIGRRNLVVGQEDMIVDAALDLADRRNAREPHERLTLAG